MIAESSHPDRTVVEPQPNNTETQLRSQTRHQERTVSPLVGLLAFSAILVTACTLPPYFILRKRVVRVDGALNDVVRLVRKVEVQHAQAAEVSKEVRRVREQIEVLKGQVDKVAGDVKDVRSVLLKERVRLAGLETRFEGLSEQLKYQEARVLSGLATEQKRQSKTENDFYELRKTADRNASNLSKVAVSLADIANFIDQTELEHGKLEGSKRVNALRDSALGVWQSIRNGKACKYDGPK